MKSMEGILKLADNEFTAIAQNGKFRSREEIDSVYKLIDIVKDIHCIWAYEDEEESEYSETGYGGGRRYDDGMSYARGRNSRRDSMGRYSRDDGMRGGRSYRDGYSRGDARSEYIDHLHEMMENAPDENTRQSIKRMIDQMEKG